MRLRKRSIALTWTAFVFVLGVGAAHAAEQVVLESTAAAYSAGDILDAAATITLAADEFVVVATEDGEILRVEGPHAGPASGERASDSDRLRRGLARLLGGGRLEPGGLAGVRGGPEDAASSTDSRPSAWILHAERGGDQCVLDDHDVELWREDAAAAETFAVLDLATNEAVELRWPDAQQRLAWPFASPPGEARVYLVRPVDEIRSVAIRVHTLAAGAVGNPLSAVAWLAAKGCTDQARMLLAESR